VVSVRSAASGAGRIIELSGFLDPALRRPFELPEELPQGADSRQER
jgi:hypothetical protein